MPRSTNAPTLLKLIVVVTLLLPGLLTVSACRQSDSQDGGQSAETQQTRQPVSPNVPAPAIEPLSSFRPIFYPRDEDPFAAGTAFAVKIGEHDPIILTAYHLFGPDGGVSYQMVAEMIPSFLDHVEYIDLTKEDNPLTRPFARSTRVLVLPGATVGTDGTRPPGDIVAFWLDGHTDLSIPLLRLADQPPLEGEPVWMLARVINRPADQIMHRAVVNFVSDGELQYRFDESGMDITATSGAPIVNHKGEVVGINIAGGTDGTGFYGFANPVKRFRAVLYQAIADATSGGG